MTSFHIVEVYLGDSQTFTTQRAERYRHNRDECHGKSGLSFAESLKNYCLTSSKEVHRLQYLCPTRKEAAVRSDPCQYRLLLRSTTQTNVDLELATFVFVQERGVPSAHGDSCEELRRLRNTSSTKQTSKHYSCGETHMAEAVQASKQGEGRVEHISHRAKPSAKSSRRDLPSYLQQQLHRIFMSSHNRSPSASL